MGSNWSNALIISSDVFAASNSSTSCDLCLIFRCLDDDWEVGCCGSDKVGLKIWRRVYGIGSEGVLMKLFSWCDDVGLNVVAEWVLLGGENPC
ncbi:hypothetical protein Hanom_Chr10g00878771 [Helianthus anomalus]